jgi:hypothetical protein
MSSLNDLLNVYRETYECAKSAEAERARVMETPEYLDLQAKLAALTASIPNWAEELNAQREDILSLMNAEGIQKAEGFVVKTRTSRSVDVRAVLEAVGGDIDALMLITSVKQKDLEEFAKANPDYKRDLRKCIREEGVKVVDVIPVLPS